MPKIDFKKILLYYSLVLSTILLIGGFYSANNIFALISGFLFLPVAVFVWWIFLEPIIRKKQEK